jgi:hypothetical protein
VFSPDSVIFAITFDFPRKRTTYSSFHCRWRHCYYNCCHPCCFRVPYVSADFVHLAVADVPATVIPSVSVVTVTAGVLVVTSTHFCWLPYFCRLHCMLLETFVILPVISCSSRQAYLRIQTVTEELCSIPDILWHSGICVAADVAVLNNVNKCISCFGDLHLSRESREKKTKCV